MEPFPFPMPADENREKKSPHKNNYQYKKMRRQQAWADYFTEEADKFKSASPFRYDKWISAVFASAFFGDTLSKVRLREELDRLAEKEDKYQPNKPKERLQIAHQRMIGLGNGQNVEEAVASYRMLAEEHNLAEAQFALGMCYLDGILLQKNAQLAMDYLEKAMNQGHFLAKSQYTLALFMEKGGQRDLHFCFRSFLDLANQGCAFASTIVGIFYQYGIAVDCDPRMAQGYLKHGGDGGFPVDRLGVALREVVEELIYEYMDDFPEIEQ